MIRRRVIITDGLMGQNGRRRCWWIWVGVIFLTRLLLESYYTNESHSDLAWAFCQIKALWLCAYHYTITPTRSYLLHYLYYTWWPDWCSYWRERERERGSKAPLALSNLGYPGYITCIHTIHTAPPYNRLIISQLNTSTNIK